jgi:hypothetical protein
MRPRGRRTPRRAPSLKRPGYGRQSLGHFIDHSRINMIEYDVPHILEVEWPRQAEPGQSARSQNNNAFALVVVAALFGHETLSNQGIYQA